MEVKRDMHHTMTAQQLAGRIMKEFGTEDPAIFLSAMSGCSGWVIAHLSENVPSKVKAMSAEYAETVRKNAIDKMIADDQQRRQQESDKR